MGKHVQKIEKHIHLTRFSKRCETRVFSFPRYNILWSSTQMMRKLLQGVEKEIYCIDWMTVTLQAVNMVANHFIAVSVYPRSNFCHKSLNRLIYFFSNYTGSGSFSMLHISCLIIISRREQSVWWQVFLCTVNPSICALFSCHQRK